MVRTVTVWCFFAIMAWLILRPQFRPMNRIIICKHEEIVASLFSDAERKNA